MKLLVVSKYAVSKKYRPMLNLPDGLDLPGGLDVSYVGVGRDETDTELSTPKQMRAYFRATYPEGDDSLADAILALGNEGLNAVTGHSGIMKYRGRDLAYGVIPAVASVSPAAIERTPSLQRMLDSDIESLFRTLRGETVEGVEPDRIRYVGTVEVMGLLHTALMNADAVAFDLETSGYDEFAEGAFIVSIALTTRSAEDGTEECWAVPLCHPEAPSDVLYGGDWQRKLQALAEHMRKVPIRIGHNVKFDCRWQAEFGAPVPATFDTMLAAHFLDENRPKGLKPLARMLLGAPEWAIEFDHGKNAPPWYEQIPLQDILTYNGLDTWHTMGLYKLFAESLQVDPRLQSLFTKLIMPASQSLVHIERYGIYVDRDRLTARAGKVDEQIEALEVLLNDEVPEYCPHAVNWNPSNFLRWFLFEHCEMPVLKTTEKGQISVDDVVMQELAKDFDVASLLQQRAKLYKLRSTYLRPYQELITPDSRIRTTFKLAGTVTGRMASGKADEDKITGARDIKGVNAQNVPRNPLVRGLFGAPPGWYRVDADYSQLELRIAAELADEQAMIALFRRGEDIHKSMAVRLTGKTPDRITKEERTSAKAANFGFLFGMREEKFVAYAKHDYGVDVTMREAEAFRNAYFQQFPGLLPWHTRQKRLAHKYKRVQSPLGRIRHLPDIDSPNHGVQAEAERQAINAPVQGFGFDLCLLSICILHRQFIKAKMRTVITNNVHDSIGFEIPEDELDVALPMIKRVMENPPIKQLFGYELRVPLVVDISVGLHWGEQKEIML